jgi:hypothetical protein
MTIERDGEYDVEGNKADFVASFLDSAESASCTAGYTVTVIDDSSMRIIDAEDTDDDGDSPQPAE